MLVEGMGAARALLALKELHFCRLFVFSDIILAFGTYSLYISRTGSALHGSKKQYQVSPFCF